MNFMFEWQEQYLTSERSERVRYCSCHLNIKFISSRHRVISSVYILFQTQKQLQYITFTIHYNKFKLSVTKFYLTLKQVFVIVYRREKE